MLKDTKSLGNNKAPACESRGFVLKNEGVLFDTPSYSSMLRLFFHEAGSNSSVLPPHYMTLPYQNSLVKWNLMCLKSI